MSTSEWVAAAAGIGALGAIALANAQQGPGLGAPVTVQDLAAWDISIGPDGAGLPAGKGTAAIGAGLYQTKCIACHGEKGAGKPSDQLVGGQGTLRDAAAVRTVGSYWPYATTLYDYIHRAMPYAQPQSLTPDEVYALTAYVLFLNDIVGENEEMNATTLPKVKMPNRDNFFSAYEEPKRKR